jgi:hemoglobin/transferrin/lactoferrin receptor protein
VGFTNFQFGYTTIPNPELKSETSRGYEFGLRYSGETARFSVNHYKTNYDDFIQSFQSVGLDPITGLLIFQSINVDEVSIDGFETQLEWAPTAFPDGLSLRFAASWSEGDNDQTGQPLNTIAPLNGVLGLSYAGENGRWGGSLLARGAEQQDRLDESAGALYLPGSYVVFDASAWFQPTANTRIRGGLFNLTDEDYTQWLDVAGLPANVSNVERFRSPGFNVGLLLDIQF